MMTLTKSQQLEMLGHLIPIQTWQQGRDRDLLLQFYTFCYCLGFSCSSPFWAALPQLHPTSRASYLQVSNQQVSSLHTLVVSGYLHHNHMRD